MRVVAIGLLAFAVGGLIAALVIGARQPVAVPAGHVVVEQTPAAPEPDRRGVVAP